MMPYDPTALLLPCDNCGAPTGQECADGCPGYVEDDYDDEAVRSDLQQWRATGYAGIWNPTINHRILNDALTLFDDEPARDLPRLRENLQKPSLFD